MAARLSSLAAECGLPLLPIHFPIIVGSFLLASTLQLLSPVCSPIIAPSYKSLSKRDRSSWDTRVVALVHALWATPTAIYILTYPGQLEKHKIWGYDAFRADLYSVTTGYFLWDSFISLSHVRSEGFGYAAHAVSCFLVFISSYRPFLMYFGGSFLLWEASSVFLNIGWFLLKTGRGSTTVATANGVLLLVAFFACRIVYGAYSSYLFFVETAREKATIPPEVRYLYSAANVILMGLNIQWFYLLLLKVQQMFKEPQSKAKKDI